MKNLIPFFVFALLPALSFSQFAPQAGITGSDAIHKSSSGIVNWAQHCTLKKGWMDIANPSLGKVNSGDSSLAIGMADNMVVSLGDSGIATLTFQHPIFNGSGADFAVFENGFLNSNNSEEAFLELAFVEVSSDGIQFFRFPATSNTQTSQQISGTGAPGTGDYINARDINNLAGKHISNYGTPFDLEEMKNIPGLDVNHITHIRLVDVIGSLGTHASFDKDGNKINDPHPTPFPTSGFDLDALAVMHQTASTSIEHIASGPIRIYPNPATDKIMIETKNTDVQQFSISDISGKRIGVYNEAVINLQGYSQGLYFINWKDNTGRICTARFIKK